MYRSAFPIRVAGSSTWMVSDGNGFANIWNCPVRESNKIVWLLFVNAKMYLGSALCFDVTLLHPLVVWTHVKLQHESHH